MPPLLATILALPPEKQAVLVRSLPEPMLRRWIGEFGEWAHDGQSAPAGDWRTWVIMGGRGFGKTRAGAEWVLAAVRGAAVPDRMRVALVGATIDDARAVMVEGPSGLLALARPGEIARWRAADRTLVWANGAEACLFSGRSPQGLRGPEHDIAWCDELGKWRHAQGAWDMLQLGLRRGERPRAVVTTTPSAEPALARLLAAADTVRTGGASRANRHLPAAFLDAIDRAYGGTRLGRQEIEGELLLDREGSLWPGWLIERCRWGAPPGEADWVRIVVGVDPPTSAAGTCGIVVAGLARDGLGGLARGHVLADRSVAGCSPERWAQAVARAARDWGADRVVAEGNQGGDMVSSVLRGVDATLPVEVVHAARGKAPRAEPVAALFERGEAGLAGSFPALEAQLGGFTAGGWQGEGASPDRADAMVWALWALMLKGRSEPRVRAP
ncbi:MAG: DNA-packaging protein [Janthinobacterium lividum]